MIIIILMIVIKRPGETERIRKLKKWVLLYGRRKTGKTFLVENFVNYDEYFFVKRDGGIISRRGDRTLEYETFVEILKRGLAHGGTVVVDEFHRLGDEFLDFVHYMRKEGKLILISSTLFLSKKLFFSRSPLLGFFAEVPLGLIEMRDSLKTLRKFESDKKLLFEMALLFREPIAIGYFEGTRDRMEIMAEILRGSTRTVPALVGEIFLEEERQITGIYEGILRAIASGKVVSGKISSFLYSRRLIKKDDPSIVQRHLANLVEMGVIKRIGVYGKRKYVYKHVSPLTKLYYYADEKYNISERTLTLTEAKRIVNEVMPYLVEDCVREVLANKFGLAESVVEARDFDVDACLLRFKRPEIAVEVKWKRKVTDGEVRKAEENLNRIRVKRRILFVPDKSRIHSETLEVMDVSNL